MGIKKLNNSIVTIGLITLSAFLIFSKKSSNVTGIGKLKRMTVDQVVKNAWNNRFTGKEKIVNETLHYGNSNYPYAYIHELKESGVNYIQLNNSAFGKFLSKRDLQQFVEWLYSNDGYLYTNY